MLSMELRPEPSPELQINGSMALMPLLRSGVPSQFQSLENALRYDRYLRSSRLTAGRKDLPTEELDNLEL